MLYNLQTLKLANFLYLTQLPKDMHNNLINLWRLDISGRNQLAKMLLQVRKLKSLQALSTFIIGKNNGTKIGELREISYLRVAPSI